MGVDLRLHPLSFWQGAPGKNCHLYNAIELDRRRELWTVFEEHGARELGSACTVYRDEGVDLDARTDAYGGPLTWLPAGDFAAIREKANAAGVDETRWNAAVFALMAALPPETVVVLWWH